ncbi:hypothetical protein D3C75_552780 [compost metagenome]
MIYAFGRRLVIEIHMVKLENHIKNTVLLIHIFMDLLNRHTRRLRHRHNIARGQHLLLHLLQELQYPRLIKGGCRKRSKTLIIFTF